MQFFKHLFWNSEEQRIRMLWRLIGQLLILIPVVLILQIALGIASFALSSVPGGLDPGAFSDPGSVQTLINQNPVLNTLAMISTGLALTISIWLAGRWLDRRRFTDFGLIINRQWWLDFFFGLGLGAGLMAVIFLIELTLGWITIQGFFFTENPESAFLPSLVPPLLLFLAVGFYEELFSRGYQLTNIAEGLSGKLLGQKGGILLAALLSSAVFGVLHASNPNSSLFSTLNIAFAGIFLAAGYLLTGQLAISVGLHITWNFFQGNVFGFPVSGAHFSSTSFIAIQQDGPRLWTGGAFGPEAGLLGLGAMFLGIFLTLFYVQNNRGKLGLHLPIGSPPARAVSGSEDPELKKDLPREI